MVRKRVVGKEMTEAWLESCKEGAGVKKYRWPPEAGGGKHTDSPQREGSPLDTLNLRSPVRLLLEIWPPEL